MNNKSEKLQISPSFALPLEFVTSTQAILARKRSGKSYTASVQAEELLRNKQQIAVIDPTSAWYGLRSSADGNGPGFAVVVFGGERADAPLDFRSGRQMARAIVEHGFSAIFDIGDFETDEQIQFVCDFARELLRINRTAIHLFIDEADTFAPQMLEGKEQKKCLGATSRLVKQGGIKGIGVTMITQRSADLNKKLLSQIDMMTALRMSHPPDIKPVVEWISANFTPEYALQVQSQLPKMEIGEAIVCSGPLGFARRIQVRPRTTFNSGATPKPGERKVEPSVLAEIDIKRLGADIVASVERAKANDPVELQRRIKDLEARLAKPVPVDMEEVKMLRDTIAQLQQGIQEIEEDRDRHLHTLVKAAGIVEQLATLLSVEAAKPATSVAKLNVPATRLFAKVNPVQEPRPVSVQSTEPVEGIKLGARKMLSVLVQWMPAGRTEAQVAAQVKMKRTGGTFGSYKSALKTAGLIEVNGSLWFATPKGRAFLGSEIPAKPRTTEEVVALWSNTLKKGAREMLDFLITHHRSGGLSRAELAEAVNMEPRGGTFGSYLSDLKTADLIIVDGQIVMANADALFL